MNGHQGQNRFAITLLAMALVAGLYLSGHLVPMLLKVPATYPWYSARSAIAISSRTFYR